MTSACDQQADFKEYLRWENCQQCEVWRSVTLQPLGASQLALSNLDATQSVKYRHQLLQRKWYKSVTRVGQHEREEYVQGSLVNPTSMKPNCIAGYSLHCTLHLYSLNNPAHHFKSLLSYVDTYVDILRIYFTIYKTRSHYCTMSFILQKSSDHQMSLGLIFSIWLGEFDCATWDPFKLTSTQVLKDYSGTSS